MRDSHLPRGKTRRFRVEEEHEPIAWTNAFGGDAAGVAW